MEQTKLNWGKLMLALLALLFVYGCSKEFEDDVSPSTQESAKVDTDKVRKTFNENGYDTRLYDKLDDSSQIYWQPSWQKSFSKVTSASESYIYVPLIPKLKSEQGGTLSNDFTFIGVKRYIIFKEQETGVTINLATYTFDNPEDLNGQKNTSSDPFDKFTGSLLLNDLTNKSVGVAKFTNGVREELAPKGVATNSNSSDVICVSVYKCYWYYTGCNYALGTSTTSYDGTCEAPTWYPSDGTNCGMGYWRYNGMEYVGEECTPIIVPPFPTVPGKSPYESIVASSTLTLRLSEKLEVYYEAMLYNCMGAAMHDYFIDNSEQIHFKSDPNLAYSGIYSAASNTVTIKDLESIKKEMVQEEFYHAYQNFYYPGGTAQYSNTYGRANIEFEAKVAYDMIKAVEGWPGAYAVGSNEYILWIYEITNGGNSLPTSFTVMADKYFYFMQQFVWGNNGYSDALIKSGFYPNALIDILENYNCPETE